MLKEWETRGVALTLTPGRWLPESWFPLRTTPRLGVHCMFVITGTAGSTVRATETPNPLPRLTGLPPLLIPVSPAPSLHVHVQMKMRPDSAKPMAAPSGPPHRPASCSHPQLSACPHILHSMRISWSLTLGTAGEPPSSEASTQAVDQNALIGRE